MKRAAVLVLACLLLASCEQKVAVVTPEIEANMIADLRGGRANLDCWITCSGTWGSNLSELKRRYATQEWRQLATLVMQIGFQEDLAYYYLGRSAEGLGAPESALRYYRIAGALGTGADRRFRCNSVGLDLCNGLSFPRDLYPRMQVVQREIPGNRRFAQQGTQKPQAVTSATTGPAASAAPNTRTAAAASPASAGPDEGWIDPPPVTR
jgi:hypothetical protein